MIHLLISVYFFLHEFPLELLNSVNACLLLLIFITLQSSSARCSGRFGCLWYSWPALPTASSTALQSRRKASTSKLSFLTFSSRSLWCSFNPTRSPSSVSRKCSSDLFAPQRLEFPRMARNNYRLGKDRSSSR